MPAIFDADAFVFEDEDGGEDSSSLDSLLSGVLQSPESQTFEIETDSDPMDQETPYEVLESPVSEVPEPSDLSEEIETNFMSLLEGGMGDLIPQLTGDSLSVSPMFGQPTGFSPEKYLIALSYNPALKWYSKFVLLFKSQFKATAGSLTLTTFPAMFQKLILPFIRDFKPELREESSIVDLVLTMEDQINFSKAVSTKKNLSQSINKTPVPTADFNPDNIEDLSEYGAGDLPDLDSFHESDGQVENDMGIDDNPLGFSGISSDLDNQEEMHISLNDLSIAKIAEFCHQQKWTPDQITSNLQKDGFNSRRISEVLSIVKYNKLNSSLNSILPKSASRQSSSKLKVTF